MESLQNVIASLRAEILAALATGNEGWEAERVTLSLNFSIHEEENPEGEMVLRFAAVPATGEGKGRARAGQPLHTLTIEFGTAAQRPPRQAEHDQPERHASALEPARIDPATANQLADSLASILGAPGFDSSGRAMVFREAVAKLSDEQARVLGEQLRGLRTAENNPEVAHAGHLLIRLVETGPIGSAPGRELLAELLQRHAVQVLLRIAQDKWKTQQEWL